MSKVFNKSRYQLLANDEPESTPVGEEHQLEEIKPDVSKRTKLKIGNGTHERTQSGNDILLIDKPILPGESLASISLKYRIPIPELKRVNKIHKDNEFYALKTVKVPARSNSALLELLNHELSASSSSELLDEPPSTNDEFCLNATSIETAKNSLARRQSETYDSVDYERLPLPWTNKYETAEEKLISSFSGTDWGISWWKLLIIVSIVLFGVPLLYYYYFRKIDSS